MNKDPNFKKMTNRELNGLLWYFGAFLFGVGGFLVRSDVYGMWAGLLTYALITSLVLICRFWRSILRFFVRAGTGLAGEGWLWAGLAGTVLGGWMGFAAGVMAYIAIAILLRQVIAEHDAKKAGMVE